MRRSSTLRLVLRSAVLEAIALTCTLPMMSCGAIGTAPAADAGTGDAPSAPGDSAFDIGFTTPIDAAVQADTSTLVDASMSMDTSMPEDAPLPMGDAEPGDVSLASDAPAMSDGGCGLPALSGCGSTPSPCIPDGLVLGFNSGPACGANGRSCTQCSVSASDGGGYTISCLCLVGRMPSGLELEAPERGRSALGTYLAQGAALESSSVRAFEQLARELTAHGAPASLVARARAAARQEVTHARLLRRAAKALGCTVPRMRLRKAPRHPRSLYELAKENAVEGCGRETLGAAVLQYQSERAADPMLRSILALIAEDETEHAELAWDLNAWFELRLEPAANTRVHAEREAFLAACEADSPPTDAGVAGPLGLPAPAQWKALVAAVRAGTKLLAA